MEINVTPGDIYYLRLKKKFSVTANSELGTPGRERSLPESLLVQRNKIILPGEIFFFTLKQLKKLLGAV